MAEAMAKSLIYVVDPMCSWCWGFSPVIEDVARRYRDQVTIELLLGGLRPGNVERFDEQRRAYILSHWHAVHERTGQAFNFEFQPEPSFTYDTEPPSRAVVVVRQLAPDKEFVFVKSVQEAFYVKNANVTQEKILADLASAQGVDRGQFLEWFNNPAIKQSVWQEFDQVRQLGVSGFPTLLGQCGNDRITFTHGYQPTGVLVPMIDEWLGGPFSGSSSSSIAEIIAEIG
ncbi:MAG: DsbA family protein [Nitrospirota bacterium]|nr:DsbA family protein [Nitrospirota bacterium]MDH5699288.1 DsbA family protein [Nitrospirota bacterium]